LGVVKYIIYKEKVVNANKLRERTVRAAECDNYEMLANTWLETEYHREVCHAIEGVHTEIH
jgi:hypothetical protein